ncbi:MAG: glycosyltransferase [Bacteroidales bacterium]|jgi:cellulose synthase/poly-beta-1,6-N-acetylglucosamine synthase-like glycosyltransferase|nr:glycosyltransferase [Bacteroidales bacterium]HOI31258.1 glycosyltransferase [Bacteroidales bacterium]
MEHLEYFTYFLRIVEITGGLYLILIGLYTLGWFLLKTPIPVKLERFPEISVLVAVRNEEERLEKLLETLRDQRYPIDAFEVIIIDDHSEDNSIALAKQFVQQHLLGNFRVLSAVGEGKKAALREGLNQAAGKYIAVTDADCLVSDGWLRSMARELQQSGSRMMLGPVLLHPARNLFERMQALEFMSLIGSTGGAAGLRLPVMSNGANMVFEKNAALEVEKYRKDESLQSGDDVFLMEAIRKHYGPESVRFVKHQSAIVTTPPCPDFKSFISQRTRWVSKNKHYRSAFILLPAAVVFAFNFMLVALLVLSILYPFLFLVFFLFTGLKLMVDFPLLTATTTFFRKRQYLILAFPLALIYPVYVIVAAFGGLFIRPEWKGRSIKKSR